MTLAARDTASVAGAGPLARLTGERVGLDHTLFLIAAGMVALSFSNAIWQSLHALGWILLAGQMIRRRSWLVPGPPRWAIPWGLFAAWSLVAAALGPDPARALYDSKKLLNLLALFFFAAVLRSAADVARILAAACVVLSAQAGLGLVQFWTTVDRISSRPHGTLSHHMTFSGMLLITASLALALLTFRRKGGDLLWWGYVGLAVAALLASLTRSAWLGLTAALVVVLVFKNPRWLLALPVALLAIFFLVPQIRDRTLSILDTRGDYSNVQRLSIYPTGLRIIGQHPLIGLGGRRQVRLRYPEFEIEPPVPPPVWPGGPPAEPYEPPDHLHNNVLQIAAQSGLPALLAWLVALAVYVREALRGLTPRRRVRDEEGRLRRNLILGSLAACTAFLTMGMLEYNFGDSEVSILFFLVLSLPFVLARPTPHPGGGGAR